MTDDKLGRGYDKWRTTDPRDVEPRRCRYCKGDPAECGCADSLNDIAKDRRLERESEDLASEGTEIDI